MADTITSEIIRETADMVLFTFTNQSDGTGKTDLNVRTINEKIMCT